MKVGEVRHLTIPGQEAYGKNGFPAWGIPPNATLEFTLECLATNGEKDESPSVLEGTGAAGPAAAGTTTATAATAAMARDEEG